MTITQKRIAKLREWAEGFSFDHMLVGVRKDELLELLTLAASALTAKEDAGLFPDGTCAQCQYGGGACPAHHGAKAKLR